MPKRTTLAPGYHKIKPGVSYLKKSMLRLFSACIIAVSLCALISNPSGASNAVRDGLNTCAKIIIPSLLPFFFISGFISSMGFAEDLARLIKKPLKKIPFTLAYAFTPFILGILGGYPIGASAISSLVKDKRISEKQGEQLLPICNNTGPAFIIGAVGGGIFSSVRSGLLLYFCHIGAALILALLFFPRSPCNKAEISANNSNCSALFKILPECVKGALDKCFSICGFVIFFAVIREIMTQLGILGFLSLALNNFSGIEISKCQCLIYGIMELGGGIASMNGLSLCPFNLALASFILGFGSLSVHCQTLAVTAETNIKCARHFIGRILHGVISALLVYSLGTMLRI